ncbi:hypothetical protein JFL43_13845 [Viridibacillus sp. YIM B01967]|uniref:ABC transporter permease n=1 Tax=Viridibacillus soli TaxID=2798301 RepID=A0ABS1H924_9BACL|nr:hypothetical protein [Viridibacillus soli]MBK3495923.1 hypothetical protein [Viridibacillus soli]
MMFLTTKSFAETLQAQVKFKLHAYLSMVVYLIILQVAGMLLFLLLGSANMSSSSDLVEMEFYVFTPKPMLILSSLWAFYVGKLMTRHDQRADIMPFVTTRTLSSIADVVVLGLLAIFTGITVMLSIYVVRIIVMLKPNQNIISGENMVNAPGIFIENIMTFIVFILLMTAIGYFFGMLTQQSKLWIFFIVAVSVLMLCSAFGQQVLLVTIKLAKSVPLPLLGTPVIASSILFVLATLLANKLEVRG